MFESMPAASYGAAAAHQPASGTGLAPTGITRTAAQGPVTIGRGPVRPDPRKFRYDVVRARTMPHVSFGATRIDRMDAVEAGDTLDRIHRVVGIDRSNENIIAAFDKALFLEHALNGASLLQPGRGMLRVGEAEFELASIKTMLGEAQRRFFRAYADDIAVVLKEVIAAYDPHEPEAAEQYGQIEQIAVERGLQKFPYLIHDSSDAGVRLVVEERNALISSKRVVLESVVNKVDAAPRRVDAKIAAPIDNT